MERSQRVRQQLGLSIPRHKYAIACRGYTHATGSIPGQHSLLLEEGAFPAYSWSFALVGGIANVGFGYRLDNARRLPSNDWRLGLHKRFPEERTLFDIGVRRIPMGCELLGLDSEPVLLAGDAAGLANPLTGAGIFRAVVSGALAGRSLIQGRDPLSAYRSAWRRHISAFQTWLQSQSAKIGALTWSRTAIVSLVAKAPSLAERLVPIGLE